MLHHVDISGQPHEPSKPVNAWVPMERAIRGLNGVSLPVVWWVPTWDVDSDLQIKFQIWKESQSDSDGCHTSPDQRFLGLSDYPDPSNQSLWLRHLHYTHKAQCVKNSGLNHHLSVLWCMASKSIVPWDMTYRRHLGRSWFCTSESMGIAHRHADSIFGVAQEGPIFMFLQVGNLNKSGTQSLAATNTMLQSLFWNG